MYWQCLMSYCIVFFSASSVQQATMDLKLEGIVKGDTDSSSYSDNDKVDQLMVDLEAGLHGNAIPEFTAQLATTKKYHSIAHNDINKTQKEDGVYSRGRWAVDPIVGYCKSLLYNHGCWSPSCWRIQWICQTAQERWMGPPCLPAPRAAYTSS